MKKTTVGLCCALAALSSFGNVLLNPGFEKLSAKSYPENWSRNAGKIVKFNGSNAFELETRKRYNTFSAELSQNVPAVPGGNYVCSGKVKGDIKVVIAVFRFSAPGSKTVTRVVSIPKARMRTAENDFSFFSAPVRSPGNGTYKLFAAFSFQSSSDKTTLLVDDLNLSPAGENEKTLPGKPVKKIEKKSKKKAVPEVKSQISGKDFIPEISGKLIANPGSAVDVKWHEYSFAGKNYWQLLTPQWRDMAELKNEEFVKNAGYSFHLLYHNRGVTRGDLRKSSISEIEVYSNGKNIAQKLKYAFDSEEKETIFYDANKIFDGNAKTFGYILGATSDFRKKNTGVPFTLTLSDIPSQIERIRFVTRPKDSAPLAKVELRDEQGKIIPASYFRSAGDVIWDLKLPVPAKGKKLFISAHTAPALFALQPIPARYREIFKTKPFLLTHSAFVFHDIAEFTRENIDRTASSKLHKDYPETYLGEVLCAELDSNHFQKRTRPNRFRTALEKQGYYSSTFDRNRFDAEDGLRKHYKRYYDIFGPNPCMSGGLMSSQYFLEWGATLGLTEIFTESPTAYSRSAITINRSGARQYNKPWGIYLTSYAWDGTANSVRTEQEAEQLSKTGRRCASALDFGLAPSVFKRLQYLSYYSGTNFNLFEADSAGLTVRDRKTGKWALTGNGKTVKNVYEWTASPDGKRGTFYAPVMLLADYFHGNWDWKRHAVWKVWYMHPFEDPDYMFMHVNRSFDKFIPRSGSRQSQLEDGWAVAHSKLGDIYDIFFANPPSGVISVEELGKYPVVFLLGDIRYSRQLAENLKKYTSAGGTVIINAAQDKRFFEDSAFSGVKAANAWIEEGNLKLRKLEKVSGSILARSPSGQPLIVKNNYGKGSVLFMTPYYLLDTQNKKKPLPMISALLEKIQQEVVPVQVSGKIHFLFNKMSGNKWKLILFNHSGVYKNPYKSHEEVDPSYASTVTITAPAGTKAKEVRLNVPVSQKGNQFTLSVPSGEVCVVDLDNIRFGGKIIDDGRITRRGGMYGDHNVNSGAHLETDFSKHAGENGTDISGKGNHGKLFHTVYENGALKFDGRKSFAVYHIKTLTDPVTEGTLECWIKPEDLKFNSYQQFLSNKWVKLGIRNGKWDVHFYDYSKTGLLTGPAVTENRWTHIVFTWNRQVADFYVNGVKVISPSGPYIHINPLEYANEAPGIYLGTHFYLRRDLFKGRLKGVRYLGHYITEKDVAERFSMKP